MTTRKAGREMNVVRRKLRSIAENADALANVIQAADEKLILVRMQELEDDITTIRRFLTQAISRPKPKPEQQPTTAKRAQSDRKP